MGESRVGRRVGEGGGVGEGVKAPLEGRLVRLVPHPHVLETRRLHRRVRRPNH